MSHQTVSFNINATEKIKCNTDYLNESENNIIQEKRYLLILDGLKTTIIISILATIFGTL